MARIWYSIIKFIEGGNGCSRSCSVGQGLFHQKRKADTSGLDPEEEADTFPSVKYLSDSTPYLLVVDGSHKRCPPRAASQPALKSGSLTRERLTLGIE